MTEAATPAMGRSCGTCTLCCKVYPVPAVENKAANVWCRHCKPGQGCGIWQTRPQFCREFFCHWIQDMSLGAEWQPSISKFVMNNEDDKRFAVICDPGHPRAWAREPYGATLRALAARLLGEGRYIMIYAGPYKHILLPDQEVHVGRHDQERIFSIRKRVGTGADTYFVEFADAA